MTNLMNVRSWMLPVVFVAQIAVAYATTVDILVAYDASAANWVTAQGSTPSAFAQQSVDRMNEVLVNSKLDGYFTFRLVHACTVPVDVCAGAALDAVPARFTATLEGINAKDALWQSLEAPRNQAGADIVVMLTDTGSEYGIVGLGNSLRRYPGSRIDDYADSAYCICSVRSVAQSYTMVHEVGHVMGAGHPSGDPYNLKYDLGPQYDEFSSGAYVGTAVTVMGYEGNGVTVIPYFSSPEVFYDGSPLGDGLHDNRRTLIGTYEAVARFRQASSTPSDAPSGGDFNPTRATVWNGAIYEGETPKYVIQLKVGRVSRKHESKVSATVIGLDGRKYAAKAKPVATGGTPTQTFDVKVLGAMTLTFGSDGFSGSLGSLTVRSVGNGSAITPARATFSETGLSQMQNVLTEHLPKDIPVTRTEKKWTVGVKAGKIKYVRPNANRDIEGGLQPVGDNVAALKISYAAKTQTFKGSFKIWTFDADKSKLKSVSAKVTGIVVDGTGYGIVTVKNAVVGTLDVK